MSLHGPLINHSRRFVCIMFVLSSQYYRVMVMIMVARIVVENRSIVEMETCFGFKDVVPTLEEPDSIGCR